MKRERPDDYAGIFGQMGREWGRERVNNPEIDIWVPNYELNCSRTHQGSRILAAR